MLSRDFYDAIALWPAAFWPIVISSCFYAYLKICLDLRTTFGYAPGAGRRAAAVLSSYVALPAAVTLELAMHGYMLSVAGFYYAAVAIPIYVFGWILLPALLDGMRVGLPILAGIYALFLGAFAVLLGFWNQPLLRAMNGDLYALLTGLPAAL